MDPYLQSTYFPGLSDPVLLEIRRERGIEMVLEGLRFFDILRWKRGELMEMEWRGFYVPAVDEYMDLNEDGIQDVYFYIGTPPETQESGVFYINVGSDPRVLSNGTFGESIWMNDIPKEWDDKKYFYPIPQQHLFVNPNLGQNPGW